MQKLIQSGFQNGQAIQECGLGVVLLYAYTYEQRAITRRIRNPNIMPNELCTYGFNIPWEEGSDSLHKCFQNSLKRKEAVLNVLQCRCSFAHKPKTHQREKKVLRRRQCQRNHDAHRLVPEVQREASGTSCKGATHGCQSLDSSLFEPRNQCESCFVVPAG